MYKAHTQLIKKVIQITRCIYCGYEEHLSIDIQCPVIGIGETLDNQQLLAKYGTARSGAAGTRFRAATLMTKAFRQGLDFRTFDSKSSQLTVAEGA